MRDPDFPDELCNFIQLYTPSMEAVELLLLIARTAGRDWSAPELAHALRPTVIPEGVVRDCLGTYADCGLVEKRGDARYAYAEPAHLAPVVAALKKAYNERPVSLVRLIYALKDKKIRSFADAFRLRKD